MHPASFHARPGLHLLPAGASESHGQSLLALWHLLSLDAPTVAAVWTCFLARCCGVTLPWTSPAAMFLAVWMLYAADRLLDARVPTGWRGDLEERHRFHQRHHARFLPVLGVASLLLAALLPCFTHAELRLFAALGSLLFAYFFLIHLWPASRHVTAGTAARLPKELAVGVFFPAAVSIPTVARVSSLRLELLPVALLLAVACTLNCLYVYRWEHPGRQRLAHWTTRIATRHLTALCVAAVSIGLAMAVVFAFSSSHGADKLWLPAMACAGSAALFLLLDASRRRLRPVALRALVDVALLTPLVVAPLLYLSR